MSEGGDLRAFEILGPAILLPDGRVIGGEGFVGHEEVRDSLQGHERRLADSEEATDGFVDSFDRFLDRETAGRLTGAGRGESTEIARVSAGRRIREEQERIMVEGRWDGGRAEKPGGG